MSSSFVRDSSARTSAPNGEQIGARSCRRGALKPWFGEGPRSGADPGPGRSLIITVRRGRALTARRWADVLDLPGIEERVGTSGRTGAVPTPPSRRGLTNSRPGFPTHGSRTAVLVVHDLRSRIRLPAVWDGYGSLTPASRRTTASPCGDPLQCASRVAPPARRATDRSTMARIMTSSAYPRRGTKSGTRSTGEAR
jgi:hypothetical protein